MRLEIFVLPHFKSQISNKDYTILGNSPKVPTYQRNGVVQDFRQKASNGPGCC